MVNAIISFLLFAAVCVGAYYGVRKLMKKNGDESMPTDLVNQVKADAVDATDDMVKKL